MCLSHEQAIHCSLCQTEHRFVEKGSSLGRLWCQWQLWDILAPEVCDGECAQMAGVQSMALTQVCPFHAFKLSTVPLEESCRCHVNAVCLAAQARTLVATPKVTLKGL